MSWIAPEQVLEDAIVGGLAELDQLVAAGTLNAYLDRALGNIPQTDRDALAYWISNHGERYVRNYPRTEIELPVIALVLGADEQGQYIGEQGLALLADPAAEGQLDQEVDAEPWTSTMTVLVYAEHPGLTQWIYHLVKFILARKRRELTETGYELGYSLSGRDLGFDPRFLEAGRFVYTRALFVRAEYIQRDAETVAISDIDDVAAPVVAA